MDLVPVIVRFTANLAMVLGVLVVAFSAWDYLGGGPGAGKPGTLVGVAIGVIVFFIGFRFFRRLASELSNDR